MDCRGVYEKWLANVRIGQHTDGKMAYICPKNSNPGKIAEMFSASVGWGDAAVLVPWNLYRIYGDEQILRDNYEMMKKWVDFLGRRAGKSKLKNRFGKNPYRKYIIDTGMDYGEWCEPGTDVMKTMMAAFKDGQPEVATAYYAYSSGILAKISEFLGNGADADKYKEISEKATEAYRYLVLKDGHIRSDRQCEYVRPLAFCLLPEKEAVEAAKDLNELVVKNDYHLNTGFLSTPFLCSVLADYGYVDTAYRLLLQKSYPSWLYAVEKGATTIWETWDGIREDGTVHDSLNHYSYGAVSGWLLSGEDIDLILSMGANSIRLAHYQHDQYFYDLCDEKGIVVWAEIPYITVHMDSGRENTISQMKELISQNYNHASIMCWALSNEISLQGVTEDLLENHRILNDIVHEMDPIRYSAMANLFLLETDSPLVTLPDIRGYNLYYGWYVGEMEDNDKWFDDFHNQHPDVAIGLTEYGADSVITLQSPIPEKGDYTESYQAVYHEHMLEMFSTRPYIWGTYLWNMFEFAAAGRDEAGDPGKNHKGVITFDRKQKKDAYYIYKAWWSDESFIHLCGKRYHDRIEDNTEIKVYSNQKSVTLFVDGVEVGNASGEHIFKFNVPISGVHTIKAVSGELSDEMEITKVSEPNPTYFAPDKKVRNWFDKKDEPEEKEGYLSLSSTMAEIQAIPEGKAILDRMMAAMTSRTAGGMGEGVEISEAMQQMIARQPLKKLLQQGGMDIESDEIKALSNALMNIKKQ